MSDPINRQAAIDVMCAACWDWCDEGVCKRVSALQQLPSAQSTLYGYTLEHLVAIAKVLEKDGLSPEKATEVFTDIGRWISLVQTEFDETLREAVKQCKI